MLPHSFTKSIFLVPFKMSSLVNFLKVHSGGLGKREGRFQSVWRHLSSASGLFLLVKIFKKKPRSYQC